ncbi:hypothetical protein BDV38DRAFT_231927 [Aspergillus pseudotamarii]|uniref:Uncharacterized protein n=1 Tax=Aspergillus pseudotamarii TaxID=132259 RepID=A0A5N6TBL0_ASPPS|nr:uncharacterized protein BDV38DRAFT_231927 [Aspergillus pseudotamarii]KAE8143686.1 hypothetical protein BDV38DRAFT_231927 [Aspergillus pseudotamarii]
MKLPAFLYATRYWNTHLSAAVDIHQSRFGIQAKIDRLFTESNVYFNWVHGADSDDKHQDSHWSKALLECQPPIERATILGLADTVNTLVAQGADPLLTCQGKELFTLAA